MSVLKDICGFRASVKDLRSPVFWRDVAAEMMTVTVLMTIIILVLISNDPKVYPLTTTHLGLFAGFLVFLLLEGYGPISGAQMNPCASLSLWIAGKISFARAFLYIIVQTLGSAAGSGIGYLMTPESKFYIDADNNNVTYHSPFHAFKPSTHHLTDLQGLAIEAFFAFNLIFVALSCHESPKYRATPCPVPSLVIGFAIGIGILAAGTHTGGLMNPIIAFGPALLANDFREHWIYWIGPFIGGPLAVGIYKLLIYIKEKHEPKVMTTANPNSELVAKTLPSQELHRLIAEIQAKLKAIDGNI